MPQELVCVYEKATGRPAYMHSIDAGEAVGLGDYQYAPLRDQDATDQDHAAARARAHGMNPQAHAELQSPEEREARRRAANASTVQTVAVPVGTPVVLMPGTIAATPAGAMPSPEGGPVRAQPVLIDGVRYDSMSEATRQLSISRDTLTDMLAAGTAQRVD